MLLEAPTFPSLPLIFASLSMKMKLEATSGIHLKSSLKKKKKKAGSLLRAPAALNLGASPRAPGVTVTVLQRELLGG